MSRQIAIASATVRSANASTLRRLLLTAVALIASAVVIGCNPTPAETPPADYGATVEALLPTADPTVPLTSTSTPPTDASAPTYTPRPQPTYTPWPTPTKATTEERQPAIPFNAQMLDGSQFALRDGFGSPTLLAFFAPW